MLLERDREVQLLVGLSAGVGSSGGKVILVRGEAGIGKTSLIREFVERHCDEAHVLLGFCDDLVTPQPLGPFFDIARHEPAISDALIAGDRQALFQTLLDLLSRQLRPTMLVIEGTQWADEATLDTIKYLGRRVAATNALLLVTYRDEEVDYDHPLRTVMGGLPPEAVVRIRLSGLSLPSVSAIIANSGLDASHALAVTDGNPFLVTEMAAIGGEVVPSSVQDSVMARAGKLSRKALEALKTLSVIPQRVSMLEVRRLIGPGKWLGECEQRGLLRVDDEVVVFSHELIRRAVERSLTTIERMAANRSIFEALPPETDPARLVHHAGEANDIDAIIEFAPAAAEAAAAVGSHREAVALYRMLEPHIDRFDPETRGLLLDSWGRVQPLVADYQESIRVQQLRALHHREQGDRPAESAALVAAAYSHFMSGHPWVAEQLIRQAIDVLGPDAAGPDLVPAFEFNAYRAMMETDIAAVRHWVDRTLEAAGTGADEILIIRCLNHRGCADDFDSYPDGQAGLDEAARRAEAIGDWGEASRALHNHASMAVDALDLPTATDYARRSIAAATREDLPGREAFAKATYAGALELAGAWNEAEDLARDTLTSPQFTQSMALPVIGAVEARKGRPGARTTLTKAWGLANEADLYQHRAPAAVALVEYAWITGDTDIPLDDIKETMHTGLSIIPRSCSVGSIALWLWELGELSEAPEGIAEPYRLIIDGQPMAAAELWAKIGCPYEEAIALSHGDPAAQLRALEKLETLGATAVAAKLRQTLRDQGVPVPRGKAQATRQHAAGLTARQAEVLALLAEGLTNPEIADRLFVSPRTVEHHVSAVLSKLDATTRQDAVTEAHKQGLLSDATT